MEIVYEPNDRGPRPPLPQDAEPEGARLYDKLWAAVEQAAAGERLIAKFVLTQREADAIDRYDAARNQLLCWDYRRAGWDEPTRPPRTRRIAAFPIEILME